jgi:hypothetical protein
MIEFEYKDAAGFEDINNQQQLDNFEAIGIRTGLKGRYIYDFSETPNINAGTVYFKNLTVDGDIWDSYSNASPGHASVMVENLPVSSNNFSLTSVFASKIPDITNTKDVPLWDENAIFYLDEGIPGTYGENDNPNTIKAFRSGYVELTFKTDKKNCIIGLGTVEMTSTGSSGIGPRGEYASDFTDRNSYTSVIDNSNAYINDQGVTNTSMIIKLNDGKLELNYLSKYGNLKNEFSILGNKDVADNNWHHVVINFTKPGTIRNHSKKSNRKFIEFWVDGQIDKRTDEFINNGQLYFPMIEWLMMDPREIQKLPKDSEWSSLDYASTNANVGTKEFNNLYYRLFNNAKKNAFRGSINHFVSGFNIGLTKFEIQQRNRLFRGNDSISKDPFLANAIIVNPTITTNKKKALKLFWNNLINDNAKNGIELDNNYQVDSYSVIHKILNSPTEVNNIDIATSKTIKYLKNVRVVLTDNVFLWGPGRENYFNRPELWKLSIGEQRQSYSSNMELYDALAGLDLEYSPTYTQKFSNYVLTNLTFSGVALDSGDRILLTNQFNPKDNGIYIFNGLDKKLTRAEDSLSANSLLNSVVRITDGYYKDTSWMLTNNIKSLSDMQKWVQLEYHPSSENINIQPIFGTRWSQEGKEQRLIDLQQDLNISDYDLIVFMNYPETNEEIKNHMIGFDEFEVKIAYENFIKSLQNVCAQGASLYVSSPKLAQDLGIIKNYKLIDQMQETSDAQSAAISPFEINEPASQYFDTHRINQYQLQTEVPGLTNKETYILTDFINYVPSNINEPQQYHAKYVYRQFGLREGNEFFIPSLSLLKITENKNLPGFSANRKGSKPLAVVEPNQINTGTIVTKLQNNYYHNGQIVSNPYDDDATTIIVHNGQILNNQPITGKIFINFIEDGYTMSRQDYNKARIQVVPQNDTNETTATRAWQYSTTRLNRLPQRINIRELTEYGQTTPTNGAGGPLIQAPTNSSNGIIRSLTDAGNLDYQSDLYPTEVEEIYPTQEIPVLSMTYLGLLWLAE